MSKNPLVFGNGVPIAPDVKRLIDNIGVPNEGDIVKYTDIEQTLGLRRQEVRCRTVIASWKKKLERENNIVMLAVQNVGYKAANPAERIVFSGSQARSGFRRIKHGSLIAGTTDRNRLTADEKEQQSKLSMLHAQLVLAQKVAPKELPSGE